MVAEKMNDDRMADVSVEEIIQLVAEERGLAPQTVRLNSRLLHDLGMDGDDAVEFFDDFQKRYGSDLSPLYEHWNLHFGPEGFGPGPLGCVIMLAMIWLPLLFLPFGISPYWVWGIEIVAIIVWLFPLRRWPLKDKTVAVTVQELVIAAETKRWPIKYEET